PFLDEPNDIHCIEGEDAILTCKLRPDMPPVNWLKNGREIIHNEKYIISTEDTQHKLTIKNTIESDSGDYNAQVGKFSKKIQLNITELQMKISKDKRNTYMEAIESGIEIRQYVRVQVIGKDRVGKTSLVRRLLYLEDGKYDGKSTDGIEINRKCQIRRNDGAWFVGEVDTQKEMMRRIGLAVDGKQAKTVTHLVEDTETTQNKQIPIASTKDIFQKTENKLTDQEPLLSRQKNRETETLNVVPTIYDDTTYADNTPAVTTKNEDENELSKDDKMMSQTHIEKNPELTDNHVITADQITDLVIKKMDEIISSSKMDKEKKESGDLVECGIWDFAGQKDYYATHQTFFTPYAIYLLVVDIEDDIKPITHDEDDCTCIGDYVDFWFDSVHCFCKDHSADKLSPPVLMVCTGTDKFEKVKDRQTKYEDKFLDTVGKHTKFNHRRGIYFLSNTHFKKEDIDEINRLRKHISNIAFEMNYFAEKLPTKWIQLETVLEVLKEDSPIHVYSWDNLLKISHKNLVEEGELLAFLNYQHKIGNIIFFDDIREYIILRPEWLVKCFRCLVCDCNIEKRNYNLISPTTWNQLKISGELPDTLIDQLFQKEPELKFADHKTHLLNVMEKFDIVIKPQFKDTSTDKCQKSDSYYLPCMIENSSSYKSILDTFIPKSIDVSITPWLVFEFEFLPLAYFNHILFYYIRKYEVCKVKALYRGKAVFYLDELSKFIICFSRNAVSVQIWRWDVLEDNVYQTVLNELCDIIETIQGKLRHTISYSIKVKCKTGDFSKSEDRIPLKDVNDREVYFCDEHCIPHSMDDIRSSWFKHHDRYYRKPDQKGLVLIVDLSHSDIGYSSFDKQVIQDMQNLSNFFKEELKYQVEFSRNSMTKTEQQNYFMEINRTYLVENSQDYHSFICVIMGYGDEGGIQTTDIPITIEEIYQIFKSKPGGKFNG
ncbi:Hypothetical predicted protein, partial [Mytilus galloprovincialis]